MRIGLGSGIAVAILAATIPAAYAAAPGSTAIEQVSYFLINGPDFREVSREVFEAERSSCMRIEVKDYPLDHVRQYHCYL